MDEVLYDDWEEMGLSWRRVSEHGEFTKYQADQPERCVTPYAKVGGTYEDIAESVAAYVLNVPLDDAKRQRILSHDKGLGLQGVQISKLERATLPKLPDVITYRLDHEIVDPLEDW